ncbi:hypothetical protein AALP_AAs51418U000100 [Arabis alpina]|uniref:Uncharacterized protein n=1 Tax=Arabis alpina TaxID=50452 RepID=A0A087FZ78_ARAAL|nr:hypothetical protein AALP_AAs51418U000100 [Arabis alpina]
MTISRCLSEDGIGNDSSSEAIVIESGETLLDHPLWVGMLCPRSDVSDSAAVVAVDLISNQRLALKLDHVYTEYSAQYLVDNARPKKRGTDLTVKGCLEFALKKGIPKAEDWTHLGSLSKPPSSYKPALVLMKGQATEAKNVEEAYDLLEDQPVGAKLHVFSPQIDHQQDRIYCGGSGEDSCYVGLRDGIIVGVEKIQGKSIATVKLWYKKEFRFVKVAMSMMFSRSCTSDPSRSIKPTILLVDFCIPRFSIN